MGYCRQRKSLELGSQNCLGSCLRIPLFQRDKVFPLDILYSDPKLVTLLHSHILSDLLGREGNIKASLSVDTCSGLLNGVRL